MFPNLSTLFHVHKTVLFKMSDYLHGIVMISHKSKVRNNVLTQNATTIPYVSHVTLPLIFNTHNKYFEMLVNISKTNCQKYYDLTCV